MRENTTFTNGTVASPDTDFEVVELPGAELLVGSSGAGFETVRIVGYRLELVADAAERLYRRWRN
jgi:hypothetical protein